MRFVHSIAAAFTGPLLLVVQASAQAAAGSSAAPPPLSLAQLLARVRDADPRVQIAGTRVEAALGVRRAAGAIPNPMAGLGFENVTLPGRATPHGLDREVMTTLTVPLAFAWQRGPRVRRANAEVSAARADGAVEHQRLASEAVQLFYRAALGGIEVTTAEDLAAWFDSLVTWNRTRVAEGSSAGADLIRVEIERDRAWAGVTSKQAELIRTRADLGALFGESGPAALTLSVLAPQRPLPIPLPSRGIRPEVQSARARLVAADAGVSVSHSMVLREFSAMAGLKQMTGATSLMAGFSIPLPLTDQNRGELAQSRAGQQIAAFELAATERRTAADLIAAGEIARLLLHRIEALDGYLARTDEARRIVLGAYREGATPLSQVLDVARAWGEARVTYYMTLYAQHESVVSLLLAQGRDLFTAIPALELPQ